MKTKVVKIVLPLWHGAAKRFVVKLADIEPSYPSYGDNTQVYCYGRQLGRLLSHNGHGRFYDGFTDCLKDYEMGIKLDDEGRPINKYNVNETL